MSRTLHRTPRDLDSPLRLGPLTLAQWAVVVVAGLLAWLALTQLAFLPALWRVVAGGAVVGLALGFAGGNDGSALLDLPRRGWHGLVAPREYIPAPPKRGPLRLALYDGRPPEEDLPDA